MVRRLSAGLFITWLTIYASSITAAVVHFDGRMLMEKEAAESYSVGILVNTSHSCSITLISKRIAVTNRHCFLDVESGTILPDLRGKLVRTRSPNHGRIHATTKMGPAVAIGVFGLQATDFYEIQEMWWGPSSASEDDWAVLLLGRSKKDPRGGFPGNHFQTFQLANSSRADSVQLISHAGYSDMFLAAQKRGHTQHDCHVIGRNGVILLHDCANSKGASGGPLWLSGTNLLLGINSHQTCPKEFADSDEACAKHGLSNGAVPIEQFRSWIDVLVAEGD